MTERAVPQSRSTPTYRVLVVACSEEPGPGAASLAEARTRRFDVTTVSRAELSSVDFDAAEPDVIVLQISADEADPRDVVREITRAHEQVPLVVIGEVDEEDLAFEIIGAGASAYLARSEVATRLLATTLMTAIQKHRTILHLRRAHERALHMSTHDQVTGLGNRFFFKDRVAQALALALREDRQLAVLVLDLSGLRRINETLGHDAGDRMLRAVAQRIAETVRTSDAVAQHAGGAGDTPISRLGGNEFTILLSEIAEPQSAARVARRVLEGFAQPFLMDGREACAQASIGISVFPIDGANADSLVRNAHAAMHSAKREGPGRFRFFAESMNQKAARKLLLATCLHSALDRNELEVHYQPMRDAVSGRLVAAEALARWHSPELGAVGPDEFIPVAEETGLIAPIGEWVLHTAASRAEAWRRNGLQPIRLAVNLSVHQLRDDSLVGKVAAILADTGLSPGQLELEITETAFVSNEEVAVGVARDIRDRGVGLALDDFGTGYSSLTHLRSFPIDRLKIDRSFTSQITEEADDAALAAAMIGMAHGLRLRVVAEGVETVEQAELLRRCACDELQGFLFSPAVPADEFARFLENEKRRSR